MNKAISRRFFIGGAAACGAFAGCRFFCGGSSFRAGDKPNLKFGVISDVHVRWGGNIHTLPLALEYFRDNGADAVMICGDIVDVGLVSDLQAVADVWEKVFPGGRAPDGRRVEKVFVTGNHDFIGHRYGSTVKDKFPDPAEYAKNVFATDMKGNWERIFGEPFAPVYMKEIKGYKFVGAHWVSNDCNGHSENFNGQIEDFYAKNAKAFDPSLPFFHAQHPHPRNTCYGSWAWGRDNGKTTAVLSRHPNAVAFSGHSHYVLTDERSIWQGEFTSIGASSLSYGVATKEQWPRPGYENFSGFHEGKTMSNIPTSNSRQGMLVSVYDDAIQISRREFVFGQPIGEDWVMPLPAAESKPFAYAERAKSAMAPEFAAGAVVKVAKAKGKTRKTRKNPPVEKDTYALSFPAALSTAKTRVYEYELVFTGGDGKKEVRRIVAPGFHLPLSEKRVNGEVKCSFIAESLPEAPFKVEVCALSSWHKRSRPIYGELA